MSSIELKKFAVQIGLSEQQLINQFKNIGINIDNHDQIITETQRKNLLVYLENKYSKKEKVIKNERWLTLKRKKVTNINMKGKNTVIITKRNHTYVKSEPNIKKNEELNKKTESNIPVTKNKDINLEEESNKKIIQQNNKKKEINNNFNDKKNLKIQMEKKNNNDNIKDKKFNSFIYKPNKNSDKMFDEKKNTSSSIKDKKVYTSKNIFQKKQNNDDMNHNNKEKESSTENKLKDKKFIKTNKTTTVKKKEPANYKKSGFKNDKFKKKKVRTKEEKTRKTIDRAKKQKNSKILLDKDGEVLTYGSKKYSNKNIKQNLNKYNPHSFEKPTNPVVHEIKVGDSIMVSDLAKKLSLKTAVVIKHLLNLGIMATINQIIDQDTALLVIEETGHKGIAFKTNNNDNLENKYEGELRKRPPIVTIMGHVDHGKTSLLDYIRKSNIANSESGSITQHIGAYSVKTDKGIITFLDTPGHAAFTAMRVRGSQCTDLIILVVAADDGLMPQTLEAINHAKAAKVPILVAINKIDKPNTDIKRIKNELSQNNLLPEEWGGDVIFVEISAKYGTNIDKLLDSILLQAELLELQAYDEGPAEGIIVESKIEKGRGVVATLLIKNGKLKKGDFILAGQEYGKIRLLKDENMNELKYATPSMPVEILGLSSAPSAGHKFIVLKDEIKAREIANQRKQKIRELKFYSNKDNKIDNMLDSMKDNKIMLPIILKTDVQGSAEAIKESLHKLSDDKIKISIVSSGIGEINESDVNLTIASKGILVAFNVKADAKSRKLAQVENIKLNHYNIIYDLINGIQKILSGKTKTTYIENVIGIAEVKDIFKNSKTGVIAGCKVIEGIVKKGESIRISRNEKIIYKGTLESLRRFKDNINEVKNGHECGISVKNFNNIKAGDHIEVYTKDIDNLKKK